MPKRELTEREKKAYRELARAARRVKQAVAAAEKEKQADVEGESNE